MPQQNHYDLSDKLEIRTIEIGNENQRIIIVDGLLKHPQALVNYACSNKFEPYPIPSPGTGYPGIRLIAPNEYSNALMSFIRPLLINEYHLDKCLEMRKAECCLSLTTKKPEELGPIQLTPHFDTSNYNQFAILLYLCQEYHGGTAFYRHNATNFEIVTPERSSLYIDTYLAEINKTQRAQAYFTDSDSQFTKIGMITAKFNRLVIYRSCLIHSPYISQPKMSVTPDPANGRLTVNSFVAF